MRSFAIVVSLLLAVPAGASDVRVFAAASLSDALRDIARNYERRTQDRVILNFGASSTLARQIEEGAPADLFLSADEEKMNRLQLRGLVERSTRISPLSNTLVIVTPADRPIHLSSPRQLADNRFTAIALAEPASVPAGVYAKKYLTSIGIWQQVAHKVIPTDNVRAALAAVESGNADAAIVYRTDASVSKRVRIAFAVPAALTPGISYPFALVTSAESPAAARRFLAYLTSKAALDVFRRYGFLVR